MLLEYNEKKDSQGVISMENGSFAEIILNERRISEKMKIIMYFKRNHECFFDNTVIFKTEICRMFLENSKLDVDSNLVLTACLMYACKKSVTFTEEKKRTYIKDGVEYLEQLGFDEDFCRICSQVNRIANITPRDKEGDILELVDNFGMLLDRDDRRAFTPEEALFILENENLKDLDNCYLQEFKEFVMEFENLETVGIDSAKIITRWKNKINEIPKYDIVKGINAAIEYRTTAKKLYLEGKKIEVNKDGIRDNKQQISADRRIKHELAKQIDEEHKFSELLDKSQWG